LRQVAAFSKHKELAEIIRRTRSQEIMEYREIAYVGAGKQLSSHGGVTLATPLPGA